MNDLNESNDKQSLVNYHSSQKEPLYYDLETGEYLGAFKSKQESKEYFLSIGMSENDYDWLENNKDLFDYSKRVKEKTVGKDDTNTNVIVIGDVNDTYKINVNTNETLSNHRTITKLRECNYRTAPKLIASILESLFFGWNTEIGYWLYVAQHWNPKSIRGVISVIIKQHQRGETKVKNPAKYFTYLIKKRPMRKKIRDAIKLRETNSTQK